MLRLISIALVLAALFGAGSTQLGSAAERTTAVFGGTHGAIRSAPLVYRNTLLGAPSPLAESVLYSFKIGNDGVHPYAPVISDSTGALYGTTYQGGGPQSGAQGIVYKLTPVGSGYSDLILYRFHGPDGANPQGGLVEDATGALYGTTVQGGAANAGTVFKLTPNNGGYTETVLYSFSGFADGKWPASSLIIDSAGALYGTTQLGGPANEGTVFKLTPSAKSYRRSVTTYFESVLYGFQGGADGAEPFGSVLADASGALYGTTRFGGSAGQGTVFKLVPNGNIYSEAFLYSFKGGTDGSDPTGSLIADARGALFGTTTVGGSLNQGTVFELNPNGNTYNETILFSFQGGADGYSPTAGLVADSVGGLYGTTASGGNLNLGTVFKLTPGKNGYTQSILYSFSGGYDGSEPFAALIFDNTGSLYGTTYGDNVSNDGSVFKLSPNGNVYNESVLHSFHSQADGDAPQAALIGDPGSALYGTTRTGGAFGMGAVFRVVPTRNGNVESVLYSFQAGADGAYPVGSLIADNVGALYGTTAVGGAGNAGTVFRLAPSGNSYRETILYSFQGGADGANPQSALLADSGGALYGTATNGGATGTGTVFKLTPIGGGYNFSVLYTFPQFPGDGAIPLAALISDNLGALYGTTADGGSSSRGTVFKLTPSGGGYTENVLYSFGGLADGADPVAALLADGSGALYGTTLGTKKYFGTVFQLTPSGNRYTHTILHEFAGKGDGSYPKASLIADSSGSLYGTTAAGGTAGLGTVFKMTPTANGYTMIILHDFHGGTDGATPLDSLLADRFGALYGTTTYGGKLGVGTVFKVVP